MANRYQYPTPYTASSTPAGVNPQLREFLDRELKRIQTGIETLLAQRDNGSYTPVVSCDTPGDLSISYNTQQGSFWRIQDLVLVQFNLNFTPTFSTATGSMSISLPFECDSVLQPDLATLGLLIHNGNLVYQANRTMHALEVTNAGANSILYIRTMADSRSASRIQMDSQSSGSLQSLIGNVLYLTNQERIT